MKKLSYLFLATFITLSINSAHGTQNCYSVSGPCKQSNWYPKRHKVCHFKYYRRHCKWVKSFYHRGNYVPAHKICWRSPNHC